jgi:hypothetical protein
MNDPPLSLAVMVGLLKLSSEHGFFGTVSPGIDPGFIVSPVKNNNVQHVISILKKCGNV